MQTVPTTQPGVNFNPFSVLSPGLAEVPVDAPGRHEEPYGRGSRPSGPPTHGPVDHAPGDRLQSDGSQHLSDGSIGPLERDQLGFVDVGH